MEVMGILGLKLIRILMMVYVHPIALTVMHEDFAKKISLIQIVDVVVRIFVRLIIVHIVGLSLLPLFPLTVVKQVYVIMTHLRVKNE
jgi:hypothetical protein